jgi:hypothetical protein
MPISKEKKAEYNRLYYERKRLNELKQDNINNEIVEPINLEIKEIKEVKEVSNEKNYKLKYKSVKQERDDLKLELERLKFECEKLNMKLEHKDEIIELLKSQKVIQPIIEKQCEPVAEQPKVVKTNRFNETKIKIENNYEKVPSINVAINNFEYSVNDIISICNGKGESNKLKFANGVANCLVKKLKKYYDNNKLPLLCSDTYRKVLHFKNANYKVVKMEDKRVTYSDLLNDKKNPNDYERSHEDGLYILYKDVTVLDTDENGNYIEEWVKEDTASGYSKLGFIVDTFVAKVRQATPKNFYLPSEKNENANMDKLGIMTQSVNETISDIVSKMCNSVYVGDEEEQEE